MARDRRRRAAQTALALGASAAVFGGIGAPEADAQEEATTTATCTIETLSQGGTANRVRWRTTGLTPGEFYMSVFGQRSDGHNSYIDGVGFEADSSGTVTPFPTSFDEPPMDLAWVLYHDTNGDHHWTPDEDETFYRGSGTITDCPQTITLSPK